MRLEDMDAQDRFRLANWAASDGEYIGSGNRVEDSYFQALAERLAADGQAVIDAPVSGKMNQATLRGTGIALGHRAQQWANTAGRDGTIELLLLQALYDHEGSAGASQLNALEIDGTTLTAEDLLRVINELEKSDLLRARRVQGGGVLHVWGDGLWDVVLHREQPPAWEGVRAQTISATYHTDNSRNDYSTHNQIATHGSFSPVTTGDQSPISQTNNATLTPESTTEVQDWFDDLKRRLNSADGLGEKARQDALQQAESAEDEVLNATSKDSAYKSLSGMVTGFGFAVANALGADLGHEIFSLAGSLNFIG